MNKYTELLEKHVQWIALGIGGLWLLFMVYTHVIVADSATVEVGGQTLGANDVDKYVLENKGVPLREAIGRNDKLTEVVKDYRKEIQGILDTKPEEVAKLEGQGIKTPGGLDIGQGQERVNGQVQLVKALPKVPKPVQVDAYGGRSVINPPMPPGGAVAPPPQLVSWVTVHAVVPMADLAKAFAAVNLPNLPQLHQTTLLKVELGREELLPDGKWGNAVLIASQDFQAQAQALATTPWPPANNQQAQLQFAQWAAANQKMLAQPQFFQVVRGDPWHAPGVAPAAAPGAPQMLPPMQPPEMAPPPPGPGPIRGGPNRQNPTGPRGPGRGPIDRGERGAASTPPGVVPVAQMFEEPAPGRAVPGVLGAAPAPAPAGQPAAPQANVKGEAPTGPFDPANATDINIWVHDITVEPGKTYRYAIRYSIKNPIFPAIGVAQGNLNQVFDIASEPSDKTQDIVIPHTVIYFATAVTRGPGGEVKDVNFEIFTWDVNGLTSRPYKAVPGDMLDDTLKVTLVDVRNGGAEIILMDENGTLSVRNVNVDGKNNAQLDQLRQQVKQAVAPLAQQ